jgi:ribonuclease P protein component
MPMNMSLFSFRKDERLSRKKSIDRLFKEGGSFFIHPFKVYWLNTPVESPYPAQVMIIVGKRAFKRAVDRNRIRRQVREIYRQNKPELYQFLEKRNQQCLLAFIYSTGNYPEFSEMDKKIKSVLRRLMNDIDMKLNNINRSLSDN